jgi:hypothetical protein
MLNTYAFYIYIWGTLNLSIREICRKRISSRGDTNKLAKYVTSYIATITYLYTSNIDFLTSYYFYSLVIVLHERNNLFLLHHIGSIICCMISLDNPDHDKIIQAIYWLKLGDLFGYPSKIAGNIYEKVLSVQAHQTIVEWCMFVHVCMSLVYRCILPFQTYPIHDSCFFVIGVLFHVVNFWWFYGIWRKFVKKVESPILCRIIFFVTRETRVTNYSE